MRQHHDRTGPAGEMRERLRKWALSWFVTILVRDNYEQYVGAVSVRGVLYIITTDRVLRYDPERDQVTTETHVK